MKERTTYIGVPTDLIQNLRTESTRETLERSHIIDMTHAAPKLILITTIPHGAIGSNVLVIEFSDPGRVLMDADTVLEDDKVRVRDGVCLNRRDDGGQEAIRRVQEGGGGGGEGLDGGGGGQEDDSGYGGELEQHCFREMAWLDCQVWYLVFSRRVYLIVVQRKSGTGIFL